MIVRQLTATLIKFGMTFHILAITGPRQVGKTTLAKQFARECGKQFLYLDLESPRDFEALNVNAQLFLEKNSKKLVIIDEVQRMKSLFPLLRHLADSSQEKLRFLVLGSASPDMIRDSSETLAGRIAYTELTGLNISETGREKMHTLWFRGGFPIPFLEADDDVRRAWFDNFIFTYVQRDLPAIGLPAAPQVMYRLVRMLAQMNAQLMNYSDLSNALGLSVNTVKTYIDFLIDGYMVRKLEPWHNNSRKRLVKTPKLYFRDTGILHSLLSINNEDQLFHHPAIGHSFETFALNEIIDRLNNSAEPYFYREHGGGEIDLVLLRNNKILAAIEFKISSDASLTNASHSALQNLNVKKQFVISADAVYPVQINKHLLSCSLPDFLDEHLPQLLK